MLDFEGLTFYEVMSATIAQGGHARNAVPDEFKISLNYRFAPGKTIATAKQDIIDLVLGEALLEFVDECPSGPFYSNNTYLNKFIELNQLTSEPKQAWTDVARLALFDIPAVNFGPGDTAQAHQRNEIISKENLYQNYKHFLTFFNSMKK